MSHPPDPMNPQELGQAVANLQQHVQMIYAQLIRARQRVYALHAESKLRAAGRAPRMPIEFTSQFGEDLLIYDLFDGKPEGFFIEAGAFDGYRYSVTYALEAIGWNGLLVEAIPAAAEQCRARRPNSRVVHAALSRKGCSGQTDFTVVEDQYGGMLSYHVHDPDHLAAVQDARRQTVSVPLRALADLLVDHTGDIDLAVIDVEGAELNVLDGLELRRFAPRVIMLEDDYYGRAPEQKKYMSQFPYTPVVRAEANQVYIRSDQGELLERMHWLRMI